MLTAWSPSRAGLSAAPTSHEDWRLPGCGEDCRIVLAIRPGLLHSYEFALHDPAEHEDWGRAHCGMPHGTHAVVETGPLRVDLGRVEVTVDGRAISMTPVEMRLLLAFSRMGGQLVDGPFLIEATWGPEYLLEDWRDTAHLVRVNIARLRAKLGHAGDLITTVLGLGYRLEMIAPGEAPPTRYPLKSGGRAVAAAWATRFSRCICCGTTRSPHKGHGRCRDCYRTWTGGPSHVGPCGAPLIAGEES